jgi:hypothetical protein
MLFEVRTSDGEGRHQRQRMHQWHLLSRATDEAAHRMRRSPPPLKISRRHRPQPHQQVAPDGPPGGGDPRRDLQAEQAGAEPAAALDAVTVSRR